MSDNLGITPGSGAEVATTEVDGVHHQRLKVEFGPDGAATLVVDSTGQRLPVSDPVAQASLVSILAAVDGLEGFTDGLETLQGAGNTSLASILAKLSSDPATQTTLAAVLAAAGATGDAASASTLVGLLKAIKASLAGTLTIAAQAPADQAGTLTDGRKTVTAAGTAEAIRASLACKWVTVTALLTNTLQVNVGGSGSLATSGGSTGTALQPGGSVTLPVSNANLVFVDARVSGEGVSFTVGA
jgi:hypothetical protein